MPFASVAAGGVATAKFDLSSGGRRGSFPGVRTDMFTAMKSVLSMKVSAAAMMLLWKKLVVKKMVLML